MPASSAPQDDPCWLINVALDAENPNSSNRHTVAIGGAPTGDGRTSHCHRNIVEEARNMSLGASIFLLVVGAVLYFAVDVTTSGFSIHTVGIILMVAGALGLVLSLLFWSSFSPYRRGGTVVGGDTVVEERHIHRDVP
jgi:small-conductance mechanosensitive channel